VRINFVESADGATTLEGRSGPLGGETDRRVMQVLRSMADVVLVGAGTVRVEGYGGVSVSERDSSWRSDHGLAAQPALAIVSRGLRLDPDDPVFSAGARPAVVTCESAPASRRSALQAVAEVIVCGDGPSVDLVSMLGAFAARGWTQILCEGGPHLFGALLDAGLVDEVCVTLAPRFTGGSAGRIVQGAAEVDRPFSLGHALTDDDGFVFLRYLAG
jgi:riboflavin biosynthesis pyrimidine reductase